MRGLVIGLLLLIFLFVGVMYWRQKEAAFIEVGDSAVIIPITGEGDALARELEQEYRISVEEFWVPDPVQIMTMQVELPMFLKESQASFKHGPKSDKCKAQYFGIVTNGKRLIFGNFFCRASNLNWKKYIIVQEGGGDSNFQVQYNPESQKFVSLQVNHNCFVGVCPEDLPPD